MIASEDLSRILDRICPMHVMLNATGHMSHIGPTLRKLRPDSDLRGRRFLELFELTRPRSVTGMRDLRAAAGAKLHLRFRDPPQTSLKAELVPLPGGSDAVVTLSFGISLLEAVRDYDLTSADFAVTDLTIELLYLVESKSAAMDASRRLNQRLQGARIAAEEQAFTDTLTGLKNRRAMDHVLERKLAVGATFGLMHLDLDYFKSVNDTLGHAAGDHVLQHVARVMVEETRENDTVARIGGDEFVLIFDALTDRRRLDAIACRLIERLERPIPFNGQTCQISASAGTALSDAFRAPTATGLLNAADLALYSAKNSGRGRHVFHDAVAPGTAADGIPAPEAECPTGIPKPGAG